MSTYQPTPGTSPGAPGWGERKDWPITILGPLPPDTFDAEDVGPMFRAEFTDGVRLDVFADEVGEDQ